MTELSESTIPAAPVCVISPHLDDAVLSCGRLLAASDDPVVLTLLGGSPPAPRARAHDWDRETTGCDRAGAAVAVRQDEDREAAARLGARALWSSWSEYHSPGPTVDQLSWTIVDTLRVLGPRTVVLPLGIFHPHHVAVSEAALAVCKATVGPVDPGPRRGPARPKEWYVYAETPYLQEYPQEASARLRRIAADMVLIEEVLEQASPERRVDAAAAYESQLSMLRALLPHLDDDLHTDERYWRVYEVEP